MRFRTLWTVAADRELAMKERGRHEWFAWRPVVAMDEDGRSHWVWLQPVYRELIPVKRRLEYLVHETTRLVYWTTPGESS